MGKLRGHSTTMIYADEAAGHEDRAPVPSPGFKFCVNPACGVEVRWGHPTGACRSHRSDGKTRARYRAPLAVTPAWTRVTTLGYPA
jgi:hypothetical protein